MKAPPAKLRGLDLFCGAGGATRGYQMVGFEMHGVDIKPQPRYVGERFFQGDALEFVRERGHEYDFIHASPPCQMFSAYRRARPERGDGHYANLIPQTRGALQRMHVPYAIENVQGAPLENALMLCGSSFGLDIRRHRYFEMSFFCLVPPCDHSWQRPRFDRGSRHIRPNDRSTVAVGEWRHPLELQQQAMGIDWMAVPELSQAIPPAYTEFIGEQLMWHLEAGEQCKSERSSARTDWRKTTSER